MEGCHALSRGVQVRAHVAGRASHPQVPTAAGVQDHFAAQLHICLQLGNGLSLPLLLTLGLVTPQLVQQRHVLIVVPKGRQRH